VQSFEQESKKLLAVLLPVQKAAALVLAAFANFSLEA